MDHIILSLKNITKYYGSQLVLKDVSLDVARGEFVTLLGASGCGKTTILRIIAGFEQINAGEIYLNQREISGLLPHERRVNTVFQNYALFPHMNVYDNIAYGPKVKKENRNKIKESVDRMLELVQMTGFEKRMPHQLSGGQRQRVAIARALINEPDILLLDEPLGALDLKLRQHMQTELKRIQQATGITFIYVTHDQDEALYLSDKIAVMNNYGIVQTGSPEEIYRRPSTLFTAGFVGERNILAVKPVLDRKGNVLVSFNGAVFEAEGVYSDEEVLLTVLHDAVKVSASAPEQGGIPAVITEISLIGSQTRLSLDADGTIIKATLYNSPSPAEKGSKVYLFFDKRDAILMEKKDLPK